MAGLSVIELSMRINGILNARHMQWLARRVGHLREADRSRAPADELMSARLKRFPMLLVDCHFDDVVWWERRLGSQRTMSSTGGDEDAELGRDVLTALWCLLDDGPEFHCLTGIAPAVSALWDRAGFSQLFGAGCAWCLEFQPRWVDVPAFWHRLYAADVDSAWDALQMQALQLCGRCRT